MQDIRGGDTRGIIPHAIATFRTPRPWTFCCEAGLLACGSVHPICLPNAECISGPIDRTLAAYSCGGSSGLARPVMDVAHRIPVLASDANRKNLEH